MDLFERIIQFLTPTEQANRTSHWIVVKCHRCGEVIRARVDLHNDLSIDYSEDGRVYFFCRKLLIGERGRCFQRIEVELTFNKNRRLINREISGGIFIDEIE